MRRSSALRGQLSRGGATSSSSAEVRAGGRASGPEPGAEDMPGYSLNVMVTLTFLGEGVHEYDRAPRSLQDFIHGHVDALHMGGAWAAVPSFTPAVTGAAPFPLTPGN